MREHDVPVASVAELPPGKMKCVDLGARRILLANVGSDILAADGTCTHEQAPLCRSRLRGELVKCPLHGSRFHLRSGAVLEEPATQPLRTYRVRVENGEVYVCLDE